MTRDEYIIETKITIQSSVLQGKTLIKNLIVNKNNNNFIFEYDTITVKEDTTLGDLEGVVLGVGFDETEEDVIITSYKPNNNNRNSTDIVYSDRRLLTDSILAETLMFDETEGKFIYTQIKD